MASTTLTRAAIPAGLIALPGVYQPQGDTHFLAEALAREEFAPGADVLEIGTGTGALALQAAGRGARVTAVDVSWAAVTTTRINALRRRLSVRVRHGDFAEHTAGRRYDLVVSNPPYVPAPDAGLPARGPQRAWDAGLDGRGIVDRICANAPAMLRPGGVLLMVHSGMCGAEESVEQLTGAGLRAEVAARASVPWGPVLRSRRGWLERQGFAAGSEEWEELVIIRAQNL